MQGEILEEKQQPVNAAGPEGAEAGLINEVKCLWATQKNHAVAARRTRNELKELRSHLAARLHELKALLAHSGRSGRWSSYLREAGISKATADRLVQRHESTLQPVEEKLLTEEISDSPEEAAHKLFQRLLPQLRKVITTQAAAFAFVSDMLMNLRIDGDFPDTGVEIYRGPEEPSLVPMIQRDQTAA